MLRKAIVFDVDGVITCSAGKKDLIIEKVFENTTSCIKTTHDFITQYAESYQFFTNTSLPKRKLIDMFQRLRLTEYFTELLAYEDGSKRENIEYIKQVYGISPQNILFIDDTQSNIDAVKTTEVHTLLFLQDGVSLEEKIQDIF